MLSATIRHADSIGRDVKTINVTATFVLIFWKPHLDSRRAFPHALSVIVYCAVARFNSQRASEATIIHHLPRYFQTFGRLHLLM